MFLDVAVAVASSVPVEAVDLQKYIIVLHWERFSVGVFESESCLEDQQTDQQTEQRDMIILWTVCALLNYCTDQRTAKCLLEHKLKNARTTQHTVDLVTRNTQKICEWYK